MDEKMATWVEDTTYFNSELNKLAGTLEINPLLLKIVIYERSGYLKRSGGYYGLTEAACKGLGVDSHAFDNADIGRQHLYIARYLTTPSKTLRHYVWFIQTNSCDTTQKHHVSSMFYNIRYDRNLDDCMEFKELKNYLKIKYSYSWKE
jgi:hypothetical protein